MHVNLLPTQYLVQRLATRRLWQWSIAWLLLASAGLAWNYPVWQQWQTAADDLATFQEQTQPLIDLENATMKLRRQYRQKSQQLESLNQIVNSDRVLDMLGLLSQSVAATQSKIQIRKFNLSPARPTENTEAAKSGGARRGAEATPVATTPAIGQQVVQIQGIAVDDSAIAAFIAELRNTQLFVHLDLKSTSMLQLPHQVAREFLLECRYDR